MTVARDAWFACSLQGVAEADAGGGAPVMMDERAFHALYERTARPLRAYVGRVLAGAPHVDDIVQESYLRLLRLPRVSDDPGEQRAMLFRIASNLIVDHWRKTRRETPAPSDGEERGGTDPDVLLRIDMERVFQRLTPQQRQLLWLAYVEGTGHREIAASLGLREGSVRVLLHRAKRKLVGLLGAGGRGGG